MMFALCPSVIRRRPFARTYSKREPDDPPRAGHADRLHREPGVFAELAAGQPQELVAELRGLGRPALELDPLVQVLGVLADHDEVDVRVPGRHARRAIARAGPPRTGRASWRRARRSRCGTPSRPAW